MRGEASLRDYMKTVRLQIQCFFSSHFTKGEKTVEPIEKTLLELDPA